MLQVEDSLFQQIQNWNWIEIRYGHQGYILSKLWVLISLFVGLWMQAVFFMVSLSVSSLLSVTIFPHRFEFANHIHTYDLALTVRCLLLCWDELLLFVAFYLTTEITTTIMISLHFYFPNTTSVRKSIDCFTPRTWSNLVFWNWFFLCSDLSILFLLFFLFTASLISFGKCFFLSLLSLFATCHVLHPDEAFSNCKS